ncbi:MAG: DUF805 domain-containing protein [Alphaproteobacteria bacterium]|nr:DUF805 domain-containing protein [Alphaproteobacteria bacterium]MCW5738884.1 DUF805 domain-containing protein [Alphaproteobacteria bacterium]
MDLFFSFNGRINRAKFWLGTVALFVVYVILMVIGGGGMMMSIDPNNPQAASGGMGIMGIVILIVYIAMIWPSLAIGVKRFHDRDKSGWWVLIALVPIIGGLWYLIECGFLEGTKGPNKFGPDPLGQAAVA